MARFRLFGIPVAIDQGFVLGLLLFYLWTGGGRAGLFAALGVGLFTLIHELGHALTARRFGMQPAIALNFMVGWASYTREHAKRGQEAIISLMGPLTQLAVALPLLWLIRHQLYALSPTDRDGIRLYLDLWVAVSWTGVMLAFLNLLPLWPLDGAHVVHRLIEPEGNRAVKAIARFTIAACVVMLIGYALSNGDNADNVFSRIRDWGTLPSPAHPLLDQLWLQAKALPGILLSGPFFLIIFCGLTSLRALQTANGADNWAPRTVMPGQEQPAEARPRSTDEAARMAEQYGWATGVPGRFPPGWGPSPWLEAHLAVGQGAVHGAADALRRVGLAGGLRWILPTPTEPNLKPLVALIPRPMDLEDAERALVTLEVLGHHANPVETAEIGTSIYSRFHAPGALYTVAAALARAGRHDESMAWLRRAAHELPDADRIGRGRDFEPLHTRHDYQRLLAAVRAGQQVF